MDHTTIGMAQLSSRDLQERLEDLHTVATARELPRDLDVSLDRLLAQFGVDLKVPAAIGAFLGAFASLPGASSLVRHVQPGTGRRAAPGELAERLARLTVPHSLITEAAGAFLKSGAAEFVRGEPMFTIEEATRLAGFANPGITGNFVRDKLGGPKFRLAVPGSRERIFVSTDQIKAMLESRLARARRTESSQAQAAQVRQRPQMAQPQPVQAQPAGPSGNELVDAVVPLLVQAAARSGPASSPVWEDVRAMLHGVDARPDMRTAMLRLLQDKALLALLQFIGPDGAALLATISGAGPGRG